MVGIATYAYAASNTVPISKAGDGAGAINQYGAVAPVYVLDSANPQTIASVHFTLSADATTVKIKLNSASNTWYDCVVTHSAPYQVDCTTTGAAVSSANQFRMVATN